jgi:hypothetical protein
MGCDVSRPCGFLLVKICSSQISLVDEGKMRMRFDTAIEQHHGINCVCRSGSSEGYPLFAGFICTQSPVKASQSI